MSGNKSDVKRGYRGNNTSGASTSSKIMLYSGKNSNLQKWKKSIITEAGQEYGVSAIFMETNKLPSFQIPNRENYTEGEVGKFQWEHAVKQVMNQEAKDLELRPKIYNYILSHLSNDSRFLLEHFSPQSTEDLNISEVLFGRTPASSSPGVVTRAAALAAASTSSSSTAPGEDEAETLGNKTIWQYVNYKKCPLMLWRAISLTHQVGTVITSSLDLKEATRKEYNRIMMSTNESLSVFRNRFEFAYINMIDGGNNRLDDSSIAADFLDKLNNNFSSFKIFIRNSITTGTLSHPKDLATAFGLASRHQGADTPTPTTENTAYNIHRRDNARQRPANAPSSAPRTNGAKRDDPKMKVGRNGKPVQCHRCGQLGHYMSECDNTPHCARCNSNGHTEHTCTKKANKPPTPPSNPSPAPTAESAYNIVINPPMERTIIHPFSELQTRNTIQKEFAFPANVSNGPNSIIRLDNQAGLSICSTQILTDVKTLPRDKWVSVSGVVKGANMCVKKVGILLGSIKVYAHDALPANLLSFGEMEDLHVVSESLDNGRRTISLKTSHLTLPFIRAKNDRVYTCNISHLLPKYGIYYTAKAKTTTPITPTDQKRAKLLMDLWVRCERPGFEEFRKMLPGIADIDFTDGDIKTAKLLYDFRDEISVCAKSTSHKSKTVTPPLSLCTTVSTPVFMICDIVYITQNCYMLTSLVRPVDVLLTTNTKTLQAGEIQHVLLEQIRILQSKRLTVQHVHVDPAKSLKTLSGNIGNVNVIVGGSGDHLPALDIKVRRAREIVRMVYSELPFKLPVPMYSYIWQYAISRLNTRVSTHSLNTDSPLTILTGRRPSSLTDFALRFGDYVIVNTTTLPSDPMSSRGLEAIALYPKIGGNNSWVFLNILTGQLVVRSRWTKLDMPESAKAALAKVMGSTADQLLIPYQLGDEDNNPNPDETTMRNTVDAEEANTGDVSDIESDTSDREGTTSDREGSGDGEGVNAATDQQKNLHPTTPPITPTHPRINTRVRKQIRSSLQDMDTDNDNATQEAFVIKTEAMDRMSVAQATSLFGKAATDAAIITEINNLFSPEKKAFRPYIPTESTKLSHTVVGSSMFLKAKFDPQGKFQKLKARIVGWGNQQDRKDYPPETRSSPTVKWESWMTVLAIAVEQSRRAVSMDVECAYFEATTKKAVKPVSVQFSKYISDLITQEFPEYSKFTHRNVLTAEALLALYGLVESGKLWYDTISAILHKLGFTVNEHDMCVFNKIVDGKQITAVIFVDDIFATHVNIKILRDLNKSLREHLTGVSFCEDTILPYLGTKVHFLPGKIILSMPGFVDDLLKTYPDIKPCTTPATLDLFNIDNSAVLSKCESVRFHTVVAKLLYMCIRVLHETSIAVAFLCSRVSMPTESDKKKLLRVLGYIKHVGKCEVVFTKCGSLDVHCYVDASFGVHADGKSHTGVVVFVGNSPILVGSTKQKMMAANSTEAELVGMSDKVGKGTWCKSFLSGQGHEVEATIYQDNQANIAMVTTGAGNSRTTHLKVRKFALKELVDGGDIIVAHACTKRMWADILTKPLVGKPFQVMSDVINGVYEDAHDECV